MPEGESLLDLARPERLTMSARILVCDDELHIRRAVANKLASAGFDVQTADDGVLGWEAIEREPVDLLVTDFQMPRLDGIELARRVRGRAETRQIPIILLTAKGFELDETQLSGDLSPLRVVPKPFSPRELLQLVQEMQCAAAESR